MATLLSFNDGVQLTKFARQTIESHIIDNELLGIPEPHSKALQEHRGVFVTLKKRRSSKDPDWHLRGCIGHLQPGPKSPQKPITLIEATRQAALNSALEDPRFPPVQADELDSLIVELSVLTLPEEIIVEDRLMLPNQISIGQDGLIIQGKGWHRGLLLPQVASEQGWDSEAFLKGCCQKAGLSSDCYFDAEVKIFKFQAQIFSETSPKGDIIERKF